MLHVACMGVKEMITRFWLRNLKKSDNTYRSVISNV
jgi:hypothetical protein